MIHAMLALALIASQDDATQSHRADVSSGSAIDRVPAADYVAYCFNDQKLPHGVRFEGDGHVFISGMFSDDASKLTESYESSVERQFTSIISKMDDKPRVYVHCNFYVPKERQDFLKDWQTTYDYLNSHTSPLTQVDFKPDSQ